MDSLVLHTYQWVLWLCVLGMAIGTLEFWAERKAFALTGVYSGTISQLRLGRWGSARREVLRNALFSQHAVQVLLVMRMACLATVALSPMDSLQFSVAMGLLVVNVLVFNWRRMLGDDGSDQMNSILIIVMALCVGPHSSEQLLKLGLWFIALQSCLSYTTAGVAKLFSAQWRGGEAVYRIFNTGTYGSRSISQFLKDRKGLNLLLCWSVILIETLFPLCLVLPAPYSWAILAWGAIFHLLNAIIMGLNSFFWAFVATYPAILFVSATAGASLLS